MDEKLSSEEDQGQMLEKMREDIKELGAPLIRYLKENGTPYTEISITQDGVEIKQVIIGLLSEEIQFDKRKASDYMDIQKRMDRLEIPETVVCDETYMVLGNLNEAAQLLEQEDYEAALLETYAAWQKILEFKIKAAIQS